LETLRTADPEMLKEVYRSDTGETKLFELVLSPPITGNEGGNGKKENKGF